MRRAVTAVTAAPPNRRRRGVLLAAAIIAVGLVVLGAGASQSDPDTAPQSPRPTATPDRRSAATAALVYTQELAVTGVRRPSVYGRRLRQIAAPGSAADVRAAFGEGASDVRALVKGRSGVLRAAPVGYRIDALDRTHATVSVWMVALAGGPLLEPVAQWRVLTVELRWTSAGWRVTGGHGGPGPSPRSSLPQLVADTARFEEVRHVP